MSSATAVNRDLFQANYRLLLNRSGKPTWVIGPDKYSGKADKYANKSKRRDTVIVDDARQHYSKALTYRHDDCKRDRTKLGNREVDEQLAYCRRERHYGDVGYERRVTKHERYGLDKTTLLDQRHAGEDNRKEVWAGHHLGRRHPVNPEQLTLPVGRKRIEAEIAGE